MTHFGSSFDRFQKQFVFIKHSFVDLAIIIKYVVYVIVIMSTDEFFRSLYNINIIL